MKNQEKYLNIFDFYTGITGSTRYIDIIGEIIDAEQKVPVFTPDCKFISQDNRHLTQEGAAYFAQIFEKKLKHLIKLKPAQIKMTA